MRSSTTGVPPSRATAAPTAAPSPEEPPVTSTTPRSASTLDDLLDEPRRGAALHEGQDHRLPPPLGERVGLGQLRRDVVDALGEDVGTQASQEQDRGVLVEH